jgi:putative glutamine amidotransferase
MGKDEIRINSLHSQAVDKTGSGLTAVAFDADGFIQATEDDQKLFRMGVQWHPEYLILRADQTRLFKAFAKAVHQFRDRNAS